ncbi:hypothetical protein GCM10009797_22280 [Nocardioides hwasunensis]
MHAELSGDLGDPGLAGACQHLENGQGTVDGLHARTGDGGAGRDQLLTPVQACGDVRHDRDTSAATSARAVAYRRLRSVERNNLDDLTLVRAPNPTRTTS